MNSFFLFKILRKNVLLTLMKLVWNFKFDFLILSFANDWSFGFSFSRLGIKRIFKFLIKFIDFKLIFIIWGDSSWRLLGFDMSLTGFDVYFVCFMKIGTQWPDKWLWGKPTINKMKQNMSTIISFDLKYDSN